MMKKTSNLGRVIGVLLVADILIIVLHLAVGWDVVDLDQEANICAWYSSMKLLVLFFSCVLIYLSEKALPKYRLTWLWLIVAGVFLFLSVDETASIHERVARVVMQDSALGLDIRETVLGGDSMKDSFAWVIILSPFILAVTVFFLAFFLRRLKNCKKALYCALAGLGCYLLAVGMESTIYALPSFSSWSEEHLELYRRMLALEEAGEIFGSTLFIYGFFTYLLHVRQKGLFKG